MIANTTALQQKPISPPSVKGGQVALQRKCDCGQRGIAGTECSNCSQNRESALQRKSVHPMSVDSVPAIVHEVLRSSGQSLDPDTRAFMEPRFGHDFSQVRLHTDQRAAESAAAVNALAYTVGSNVVFGAGRYLPETTDGKSLLAHELTHTIQQRFASHRTDDLTMTSPFGAAESEADAATQAVMDGRFTGIAGSHRPQLARQAPSVNQSQVDEQRPATSGQIPDSPEITPSTNQSPQPGSEPVLNSTTATTPPAAIANAVTPGGHTSAPLGMAPCPDAPSREVVVVGCTTAPASVPATAEKAVLPTLNPGRFGGNAERATFAKQLAQCRAAREVKLEIEKRFLSDVAAAKKHATEEAKADTEAAVTAAAEGLDPKDKGAINRAKSQATTAAKKAAAKKIADSQAAVTRQDVATVTAELATKFDDELAADYDDTIQGALARFGPGWLNVMQAKLNSERKRISKQKNAKPKLAKGETPPTGKTTEEVAAEIEAEMVQVRCDTTEWVLNHMEGISRAWAVGRREQVDFRTIPQKAAYLKDFKPTYDAPAADRVEIPVSLQKDTKARQGVTQELANFLSQLAGDPNTPTFSASNYSGHGGGIWAGQGFSTDIFINAPHDTRGFWQPAVAVRFLLALDATAKTFGARWRVLYNDFRVAEAVNQVTGKSNVEFIGDSGDRNLNWHGPDPLILHFHLDLEIPKSQPSPGGGTPASVGAQPSVTGVQP